MSQTEDKKNASSDKISIADLGLPPVPADVEAAERKGTSTDEIRSILLDAQDPYLEFGKFEHEYINKYIDAADRKAGVTFTITSAILIYLVEGSDTLAWLPTLTVSLVDVISLSSAFLFLTSSVCSFMVIYPRLGGAAEGFVYWGSVSRREASQQYRDEILSKSLETLVSARLEHSYELAKICTRKFELISLSMRFGILAAVLFIIYKIFGLLNNVS